MILSPEQLWQDVRHALRMMRRGPGFTAVAVLSLGMGIGANMTIFCIIYTLLLRPLPVDRPGELVEPLVKYPGEEGNWNGFSWQSYEHFRDYNHVFSALIATARSPFSRDGSLYVSGDRMEAERVNAQYVTGNFFPVLGVQAALGRVIAPGDDREDSNAVVVSWSYWRTRFNLDRAILGKRILVEDVPLTIVGVLPREFLGLQAGSRRDLWMPVALEPRMHRGPRFASTPYNWVNIVGRLKPGVTIEQARTEMSLLYLWSIEEALKVRDDSRIRAQTVRLEYAGNGLQRPFDAFTRPLLVLMLVVGVLLVIACTNVAGMLLARGAARQREMALRISLGAGRMRIVRQVLTEAVLLSASGTVFGMILARFGAGALLRIMASGRERLDLQVQPDVRLLLFTAGVGLLTGVLFGLIPALRALGTAPAGSLRQTGKAGETKPGRLFGKALVVAQVALSVVLLSAAGLFVRHLSNLEHMELGFRRDNVLLVKLDAEHSGYSGQRLARAYEELLGRVQAIPGVRSAALCGIAPLDGAGASPLARVEGFDDPPRDRGYLSENWIGPKYFETLGQAFLAGRDFTFKDRGRSRVAIVGETMARYYFGDRSPLGEHVKLDRETEPYEIVGVVADARYYEIREAPLRTIYVNTFQFPEPSSLLAIRTSIAPSAAAPAVRVAVREVLKTVAIVNVTTLSEQVDATIVGERMIATLSGLFGGLGALLAAIGLYGLLAYTVARRVNEIGIRMALGATRGDVTKMVLRDALGMVAVGVVVGAPIALAGRRFAGSLIKDLPAGTLVPIAFGAAAMIVVALVAAYVPVRRASRVDPMEALRYE